MCSSDCLSVTKYQLRKTSVRLCLQLHDSRPREKLQEEALVQVWYYRLDYNRRNRTSAMLWVKLRETVLSRTNHGAYSGWYILYVFCGCNVLMTSCSLVLLN